MQIHLAAQGFQLKLSFHFFAFTNLSHQFFYANCKFKLDTQR